MLRYAELSVRKAAIVPIVVLWMSASANVAEAQAPLGGALEGVGIDQRLGHQVPLDITLRDEKGRSVQLGTYFGQRPVVLSLVQYRCPMLCTQVLNGQLKTSQALEFSIGREYTVLTVSFDARETPRLAAEKKRRYVGRYRRPGAEAGWHFLTGDRASVERLAREVGFRYRYDAATDQVAHASGIFVLTPRGKISRYLYGIDYAPSDLRLALVESSAGKIGSVVDQFLLICYHYDPRTGKYGFAIASALRVAGSATALGLGGFLIVMFRMERRRSRAQAASLAEGRRAESPVIIE